MKKYAYQYNGELHTTFIMLPETAGDIKEIFFQSINKRVTYT